MKDCRHKVINTDDFSVMPVCILKDDFSNRIRTSVIEINNVIRPNTKHMLKSVNTFLSKDYEFSQYHFHNGIEILKINKGNAKVVINHNKYSASENDVLIINPFESHGIYLTDENADFSRTCIIFQPTDLFPSEQENKKIFFDNLRNLRFCNFVSHTEKFSTELCGCVDNIIELSGQSGADWPIAIFSNLIMFYSIMVRGNYQNNDTDTVPYQYELMTKVSGFIDKNINRYISTEEVAAYCRYSVEHFCRLFKKCFNKTFKDYLNICRIQKAIEIIDKGDYNLISDIWKSVGFNNPNYFTNIFKKYLGISPSQYINKQNEINKVGVKL